MPDECKGCGGLGTQECPVCDGEGLDPATGDDCTECDATGVEECESCDGTGVE